MTIKGKLRDNQDASLSLLVDSSGNPVSSSNPQWVVTPGRGRRSSVTITRPNTTPAYSANDVVGGAQEFASIGPSGGGAILLTRLSMMIEASALITSESAYALYLYNVTPPSALADDAAFDIPSGDRTALIGKVVLPPPVDEGSTLYISVDDLRLQLLLASSSLFFYLVTTVGHTSTALRVYRIAAHSQEL